MQLFQLDELSLRIAALIFELAWQCE